MGHKHSVYDSDAHFSIDPITRKIKNESSKKTTLVQGDHNSERCTFDVPRYIEGHDMFQCSEIEVHFDNKEDGTENVSSDYYEIDDKQISPDDENVVIFSWLIKDAATKYAGTLGFSIKFKCVEGGVSDYEWNTLENTDLSVGKGKNNSGVVAERAPNVVDQWKDQIFGDAKNAVANINLAEQNALTAVQEEGAAQVAAIQAEGSTQVENVKAAAAAIEADRDQIHLNHALKAAAIVGSAEGEVILLDDSAEQPFVDFQLFGKSEQETTEGNQLIPYPYFNGNKEMNGITWTVGEDGSVTAVGTATANSALYCTNTEHLLKEGTYTVSGSNENIMMRVDASDAETGAWQKQIAFSSGGTPTTFSVSSEDAEKYAFVIYAMVVEGKTVNDKAYPMMNAGSEALPWERYTGGIPSPNPDYPQEINSVEKPEVAVYGKNLLNTDEEVTFTGTFRISCNIPAGNYVFSFESETHGGEKHPYFRFYDNKIWVEVKEDEKVVNVTLKKPETTIYLYSNGTSNANSENVEATINKMMVSVHEGSYEPYKGKILQLPYTLHGIPVTSGGNYTDAEGQEWICDEVDLERGVIVQRVDTFILNGTEECFALGGELSFTLPSATLASNTTINCFSSHYKATVRNSGDGDGTYPNNNAENYQGVAVTNSTLRIVDNVLFNGDVDAIKTWLANQYEAGTPLIVKYILAEPIETALLEAEIEAFKSLVTKYPYTTILNDCGANMAVRYGIDTKTYIDKKFEELKASILGES